MSRGSGRRSGTNNDEQFPFWDEPDGRRRRQKKNVGRARSDDDGRPRRPRYVDDLEDWDEDYEGSDWEAMSDDDLELVDDPAGDWDEGDWDRQDDGSEEDWRSEGDR